MRVSERIALQNIDKHRGGLWLDSDVAVVDLFVGECNPLPANNSVTLHHHPQPQRNPQKQQSQQ